LGFEEKPKAGENHRKKHKTQPRGLARADANPDRFRSTVFLLRLARAIMKLDQYRNQVEPQSIFFINIQIEF